MAGFRVTSLVARVVRVFLDDPAAAVYGFELMQRTRLPSGTIYPILARLEGAGWITGQLEPPEEASRQGRPARRLYRLTAEGAVAGRVALAELTAQLRPAAAPALRPRGQLGQA